MLGLWARPHVDSGLSPQQLTFGTEILLPVDFLSKEARGARWSRVLQEAPAPKDSYHVLLEDSGGNLSSGGE